MPKLNPTTGMEMRGQYFLVDPGKIEVNLDNNSRRYAPDGIAELATSFVDHGQLQPVIVTRNPDGSKQPLRVYAGHRRVLAAQYLNENSLTVEPFRVRCQLQDSKDAHSEFVASLVENVERSNPSAIDTAHNIKRMIDQWDVTQQDAGRVVNLKPSAVSMALALLELPAKVQKLIHEGVISPRTGYEMVSMSPDEIDALIKQIKEGGKISGTAVRAAKRVKAQSADDGGDDGDVDLDEDGNPIETGDDPPDQPTTREKTGPVGMTRKEIVRFFEEVRDGEGPDGVEETPAQRLAAHFIKFFAGRFKDAKMKRILVEFTD